MCYPLITESIVIMIQPQIQLHMPLHMTILHNLVIGYFADIIILLGREIDVSQKLGFADKIHCIVLAKSFLA